jgi:hypothetical protein
MLWEQRTWNSFSSPFPGREMSGIRAFSPISVLSSEKKQQLQICMAEEEEFKPTLRFGYRATGRFQASCDYSRRHNVSLAAGSPYQFAPDDVQTKPKPLKWSRLFISCWIN